LGSFRLCWMNSMKKMNFSSSCCQFCHEPITSPKGLMLTAEGGICHLACALKAKKCLGCRLPSFYSVCETCRNNSSVSSTILPSIIFHSRTRCPACQSGRIRLYGVYRFTVQGIPAVKRWAQCKDCGHKFVTMEEDEEIVEISS